MARLTQTVLLVAVSYFSFASCLLAKTRAADDVQAFVAALRERHYHDTAAEYLESLETDARISAAVKQTLPYEQGVVLIESAILIRDPAARDRQLTLAQTKLKSFLAASAKHELALQAQQQLAAVLRTRADVLLAPSDKSAAVSTQQRTEAGKLYDESRGLYANAAKQLRGKLDETPKEDENREKLGEEWLGARVNAARTMFDLAMTRDPGDERKKMLAEAAGQCDELYSKFPQRMAGVQARLYEGRCYQAMAEGKKALAAYGDLIADLSDTDHDARQLKTLAMKHALECWLDAEDYATAVEKAVPWAKSARGAELRDSNWLEVKLSAGTALKELAAKAAKDDPTAKKYLDDAREFAAEATRSPNAELKNRGRTLLAQAGRGRGPIATTVAMAEAEIKTFDQAFEKAQEAAGEISSSQLELEFLEKEPGVDKKEIEQIRKSMENNEKRSFEFLQQAVQLVDQNSEPEKLQTAFYLLGYFHFKRGEYLEAALFGEHVARKYPDAEGAKASAKIAMVSLEAAFRKGQQAGSDVSFEAGKLAEMADYVAQKWPDQPEAQAAFAALLSIFISQGKYDDAKKMLERVKPDSPGRADAEVSMGQGLWSSYVRAMQQLRQKQAAARAENDNAAADDPKAKAELDALLAQAQLSLESGLEGLRKKKQVTERTTIASLSLSQVYVQLSQAARAVTVLEDPTFGPLPLLKAKHASTQSPGIPAEIYRTAMRAYLEVNPPLLPKATEAINGLEQLYTGDPEGEAKFTALLIKTAADMEQEVQDAVRIGDVPKLTALISTFEPILRKISESKSARDFRTLGWVAQMYVTLADALTVDGKPSQQALNFYKQAAATFTIILDREKATPGFVPKEKATALQLGLAKVQRGAGDYDKAIATFAAILKQRPSMLSVQIDAAETYQAQGATKPEGYVNAIKGVVATGIWGWGKISRETATNPKFSESFHKARYNLALCRKLFAATITKPDVKTKTLSDAKRDIQQTYTLYPDLGGAEWKLKYDTLVRDLQKELGQPVVGVQEFAQPAANPANPPANPK